MRRVKSIKSGLEGTVLENTGNGWITVMFDGAPVPVDMWAPLTRGVLVGLALDHATEYVTAPTSGIELLRRVAAWADWQREDHWLPEDGRDPTLSQIVELHALCLSWDVETPEDLATHDDPKARGAWDLWVYVKNGMSA